ncbi:hypothetical protein OEZ85_013693 [Tetradesmus obliquus]|uniref:Alpha-1,2-Mannosidase n=1 Tax=Tetradesmus obliquus TaxID=3088 RepID=A0ABY8URM3_TETOB|nr:hypothetical protein OEZ85_013693 [Tetradesmus obliquus]
MAAPHTGVLQQQAAVMDSVYGPWTGSGWRPAAFERTAPRYLWTDAFGVVNYLTLYKDTQEDMYLQQALALVDAVHNTLGHHRAHFSGGSAAAAAAPPAEWLPGASEQHPTAGGLRIGKPHPEGHPDGDGQYFHYLTKWAFALAAVAEATGDSKYLSWALDLVQRVHPAFVYQAGTGPKRMHWKMGIDLAHPAVASMGNLDPYDGLVTYSLLQGLAERHGFGGSSVLQAEIADMQAIVAAKFKSYHSDGPLDLGEALWLAHWQLASSSSSSSAATHTSPAAAAAAAPWAAHVADVSLASLEQLWGDGYFEQPLKWRLAFREFGTSIGLQALMSVRPDLPGWHLWQQRVADIHATWGGKNLSTRDNDITPVMYATSLNPGLWLRGHWRL